MVSIFAKSIFKNGTTEIKEKEFANNFFVPGTTIEMPDSITSVGASAFEHAHGILAIDFSKNITKIGPYACKNNKGLYSVDFYGSKLKEIPEGMFYGCKELKWESVPDGVEEIGPYAYAYCTKLFHVDLENKSNLKRIGSYAFCGCDLTYISLPSAIEVLPDENGKCDIFGDEIGPRYIYLSDEKIGSSNVPKSIRISKELLSPNYTLGYSQCIEYTERNFQRITAKAREEKFKLQRAQEQGR